MFCTKCGAEVGEEHAFCTRCGCAVPDSPPTREATERQAKALPPPDAAGSAPGRSILRMLLPAVLVLAIMGAFMAADRLTLHWYAPADNSASLSSVRSDVSFLEESTGRASNRLSS